jgi:hypothetical protein
MRARVSAGSAAVAAAVDDGVAAGEPEVAGGTVLEQAAQARTTPAASPTARGRKNLITGRAKLTHMG